MKSGLTAWLAWCSVCVLATGCGSSLPEPEFSAVLTGKITRGGQPLQVDKAKYGDYAHVEVSLHPLEGGGMSYNVSAEEDGTFKLELPEGQTLPPGKYRIAVHQWNPQPEKDELQGKFSKENSPIVREISGPGQHLAIDLDNPQAGADAVVGAQ